MTRHRPNSCGNFIPWLAHWNISGRTLKKNILQCMWSRSSRPVLGLYYLFVSHESFVPKKDNLVLTMRISKTDFPVVPWSKNKPWYHPFHLFLQGQLEKLCSGLQWNTTFYIVFLVASSRQDLEISHLLKINVSRGIDHEAQIWERRNLQTDNCSHPSLA